MTGSSCSGPFRTVLSTWAIPWRAVMSETKRIKVLFIEDNPDDVELGKQSFADYKAVVFNLTVTGSLNKAVAHLERDFFDVIVLDLGLPDSRGSETMLRT